MNLESELFKVVQGAIDRSKGVTGYDTPATVTRVDDDSIWVHIDGGIDETPVRKTIDAKKGDKVQVRVDGGKAWLTGNATRPPTDDSTANYAVNIANETNKTVVEVKEYVTEEIVAQKAIIGDLEADTAKIHNLTADQLSATVGYIDDLTADNVTASDIVADHAMIEDLDVQSMSAATAYIRDLTSENITAQDIIADHATIDTLDSTYATIDELHSDYAEIDLANVNNAWIQSGVIKNGAISDAQIIGVSANKLTAGTIDASNITVTNLNADNITTGTINGQRIGSESITLDKLAEEVPTKTYLDNVAQNLQGQIDGQIETWTGTAVPTLNNSPASSWSTADERHKHVGDIYYVVNAGNTADGYTYRFTESGTTTKTYSWTLIKDNQITKALQDILDIQGDISDIETFDSQISSWKTDTDSELSSLKSRTSTLETGMGNKVDTTTFNELSQTVDENSASITSLTTTVNSKADSSTVTTLSNTVNSVSQKADANESAISNLTETVDSKADSSTVTTLSQTVNSVQQTATGNSSKISQLTTTLGVNADGTTKDGDIVHQVSQIDQDLDGITTRVGKTEVQIIGSYATSTTAQGTTAKVATIVPAVTGWALYKGASITVKFTNANTATTPSLNVNSTGAKTIKTYSGGSLAESEYKWKAGDTFSFVYDGTYWRMQDSTERTRLSSAESSISQNASNISLKVSKDSVISEINQSAESVKIQASKVEIDGTAIFNAISSDVELAIATDIAGKADASDIPTKVSELTNDSGFQNATQVDTAITGKGYQTSSQVETAITSKGYQTASDVSTAVTNGVAGKADNTDALKRSQRIYYRKTSSGAPNKNTTWLSTSGTGYGNWSLRIPQLTSGTTKYPYLYTAVQTQTVSQQAAGDTCTCSDVLLDDTATIIDGGTIITGTVNANAINASSGTFDTANIPNLDADKITTGTLSADRIGANSLSIGKVSGLQTALDGKQVAGDYATNTALTDAVDWVIAISVTTINYSTNTATLSATVYKGGVVQTSGFTLQWYKNATKITSGGTSATLSVTDLNASYTCIAS